MNPFVFLHIGKTGGTSLREAIGLHEAASGEKLVHVIPHSQSIPEILDSGLEGEICFCVRDPVRRYVSGFNSRLRRGRDGNREWSRGEKKAFERFPTPNALAEGLQADNEWKRTKAQKAIMRIKHTSRGLTHYLGSIAHLEKAKDRIIFIGHQPTLTEDYKTFRTLIGIRPDIELPQDDFGAHRTPLTQDTSLSALAEANLKEWYKDDYPLYEWCLKRREELLGHS